MPFDLFSLWLFSIFDCYFDRQMNSFFAMIRLQTIQALIAVVRKMPKRRIPDRLRKYRRPKALKSEPVSFQPQTPLEPSDLLRDTDDSTVASSALTDAQKVLRLSDR